MDIKDIKDLIIIMDMTSIEKVEIEKSDVKIKITKGESKSWVKNDLGDTEVTNIQSDRSPSNTTELKDNNIDNKKHSKSLDNVENTYIIKSPIVGTFYKGSSPDAPPFVKVGDSVEKGQTLCIIEAMKIMNEIECEAAGEVIEIYADNEDIVEYGQPILKIRRHE
ncbi:acetyl-CoA carboxylase biotin carboxyl carrier protein [Proteiniborus sp.]|uniref:acetyl-CoA carboxylase biotin carboxyl carrier protein n=1 Tax=Proteiniborus sp. TaxID=2079015 RepID=UPI00332AC27D